VNGQFSYMLRSAFAIVTAFVFFVVCLAQTPSAPTNPRGVVRLRVRVKVGEATKGLPRKRFFLIKGTAEQKKTLIDAVEHQQLISRDCYYRGIGASEALIKWLSESDCESVYCREIAPDDVEGPNAVPEFQTAML